jgi:hypothetical protein
MGRCDFSTVDLQFPQIVEFGHGGNSVERCIMDPKASALGLARLHEAKDIWASSSTPHQPIVWRV